MTLGASVEFGGTVYGGNKSESGDNGCDMMLRCFLSERRVEESQLMPSCQFSSFLPSLKTVGASMVGAEFRDE